MIRRSDSCFVTLLVGLLVTATARAQEAPRIEILHASAGSALTIRGSTTIGARWHCTASNLDARLAIASPATADTTLPDVRGVAIHVPVAALRCQNRPMERAMRKALKVHEDTSARTITGRFEIFDSIPAASRAHPLLVGGLRVAGAERNVLLRATVTRQPDGSMRVQSAVSLLLSQFGITPPRVLLGSVRARDAVTVEIELHYPSAGTPRASAGVGEVDEAPEVLLQGMPLSVWWTTHDVLRAAEQFPESSYAFKPTPDVRSFGQIAGRVADADRLFDAAATGAWPNMDPASSAERKTSRAEIVQALKDAATACDAAYAQPDADAQTPVSLFGMSGTRLWVLNFNSAHVMEHYGNLVSYMRIKGMVQLGVSLT